MRILFLGCSKLIKSRIIPFLDEIPDISKVEIAKFKDQQKEDLIEYHNIADNLYLDFHEALDNSKADLIYISVVNSAHAEWAEKALLKGFHVIVDKPFVTQFDKAEGLVRLAKESNLCLAESIVYSSHPQLGLIKEIFTNHNTAPSRLLVAFSFPPLNPENFRYKRELGGGAIFDTAPYAVSIGRIFFNEQPEEVICKLNSSDKVNGIDLSYTLMAIYSKGRSLIGHFGFDTEYINRLTMLGPDIMVDVDRIFTTTPTLENEIKVKYKNDFSVVKAPIGNSFTIFIKEVINNIKNNNFDTYYDNLIYDAEVLHKIRKEIENEL